MHRLVVRIDEPHDVYIGRGSKWGNPFPISAKRTRQEAVAEYVLYLKGRPELLADLHELQGKVLGCFCAPKLCHGDVLARLANGEKM